MKMVCLKQLEFAGICIHLLLILLLNTYSFADPLCENPPIIENGEAVHQTVNVTSFPIGANIEFTCHRGYTLDGIGNGSISCIVDNGTALWKPSVVACKPICGHLPVLINGKLDLEEKKLPFRLGESIKFTCDAGYEPQNPDSKITCVNNYGIANWTETDNFCKLSIISCNDPGFIENAHRIGNVFTFPHNITYVCNEGYKLVGSATRYCTPKGQWLPMGPLCEAIVCPILAHPQNGKVISSQRRLNSLATYECLTNYKLIGNSERVCQEDGTWTADIPTCKEITCFSPGNITHGRVLLQKPIHKVGDLVIFKCLYDFHQTTSKCLDTGEWNIRPPLCPGPPTTEYPPQLATTSKNNEKVDKMERKMFCDDPGKIKNGDRIFVGLTINSTITYTCEDGYELRGEATLLCMENGKWDLDKLPICVKPLSVPSIIGIVFGVLILVAAGIGIYFWYKWKVKKIRRYGDKSKALTADATDLEEITGLECGKKPIPVTVL